MNMMIPTLMVAAMFREEMTIDGTVVPAGRIVPIPYGMALLGLMIGNCTMANAAEANARAMEHLDMYGADGLFPPSMQTITKLAPYYKLVKHDEAGEA